MAQPVTQVGESPVALGVIQCVIHGRIDAVSSRESNGVTSYRTIVRSPAPDAYSTPNTFEIRSRRRLGARGEFTSIPCTAKGYARSYNTKAGDKVATAEHVFEAIEQG